MADGNDFSQGEAAVDSGLYDPFRAVRRGSRPVYDGDGIGTPGAFT